MRKNFAHIRNAVAHIHLVDNTEEYFACCDDCTIKINQEYYLILTAIQNAETAEACLKNLQKHYDSLDEATCIKICNIVLNRLQQSIDQKINDYTHFNMTLFRTDWILPLFKKCNGVFVPSIFFIWFMGFTILGVLLLGVSHKKILFNQYHLMDSPYYMIAFILIAILHESGHIIATSRVSDTAPKVCFGFYMFMPVFFTDISHIWRVKKVHRIVATMAGYAVQMVVSVGLLFFGIYNDFLFNVGVLSFINCFMGLCMPFGRNDGYWLLVDITGMPDLMRDFYTRLYTWHWGGIKKFSLWYGGINLCFMGAFFVFSISYIVKYFAHINIQTITTWNFSFSYNELVIIAMVVFVTRICWKILKIATYYGVNSWLKHR